MKTVYSHQRSAWPHFTWDFLTTFDQLVALRHKQDWSGAWKALAFLCARKRSCKTLTLDALKSNEIEGEVLNVDQAR